MRSTITIIMTAWCVAAGPALSQPLLAPPGRPRLERVLSGDRRLGVESLLGLDRDGFVYALPEIGVDGVARLGFWRTSSTDLSEPAGSLALSCPRSYPDPYCDPAESIAGAVGADHDGLYVLNARSNGIGHHPREVALFHLRGADHPREAALDGRPEDGGYRHGALVLPDAVWPESSFPFFAPRTGGAAPRLHVTHDGELCAWLEPGLMCIDPEVPGVSRTVLTPDALAEQVAMDPGWDSLVFLPERPGETAVTRAWKVLDLAPLRDGSFAALVRHVLAGPSGVSASYYRELQVAMVVLITPEGDVSVRFGPMPAGFVQNGYTTPEESAVNGLRAWSPLQSADRLLHDARLDALVLLTSTSGGWLGWTQEGAGFSAGLLVLPLDRPGSGVLPLGSPLWRSWRLLPRLGDQCGMACMNEEFYGQRGGLPGGTPESSYRERLVRPITLPDGAIGLVDTYLQALEPERVDIWRLDYDAGALDLDRDTLSADEEADLGTSDLRADSDGGGASDADELRAATDPAFPGDDLPPGRALYGEVVYTLSELVRRVLPEHEAGVDNATAITTVNWGAGGPLCFDGRCAGPDGGVVTTFPDPVFPPIVSADGRFVVTQGERGFTRTWFSDGQRELFLPAEAIAPTGLHWTGGQSPSVVVPVDDGLTLIAAGPDLERRGQSGPYQLFACDTSPASGPSCRLVFDVDAFRCESGLGPCDTGMNAGRAVDDAFGTLVVQGWDAPSGRLVVTLRGWLDGWVLGLHPSEPPTLIERLRDTTGLDSGRSRWTPGLFGPPHYALPRWSVPRPGGEVLTNLGLLDARRNRIPTLLRFAPPTMAPLAAWDDTLLTHDAAGQPLEMVRLETRLEPGDVVIVREPIQPARSRRYQGVMAYRSGARGGLAPIWPEVNPEIGRPGDIDVTADGRLCVPDLLEGVVWRFQSAYPTELAWPSVVAGTFKVPGAVSCRFEGNDVLVTSRAVQRPDGVELPAKLWRYEPASGTLREVSLLGSADDGASVSDNGCSARMGSLLRPDGVTYLAPLESTRVNEYVHVLATWPGRSNPVKVDLEAFPPRTCVGMALVPGGSAANPWRDAGTDRPGPVAPEPPRNGSAGAAPEGGTAGDAGRGCGVGQGGAGLSGLVAALLARRRSRPTTHPTRSRTP
jgi:hypothetical protein